MATPVITTPSPSVSSTIHYKVKSNETLDAMCGPIVRVIKRSCWNGSKEVDVKVCKDHHLGSDIQVTVTEGTECNFTTSESKILSLTL